MKSDKSNNIKNRRSLFVIFGTTKGLGQALYNQCLSCNENDIITANRRAIKKKNARTKEILIDLSKPIKKSKLSKIFSFAYQKLNYDNIYLVNNASVVEPIKPIGQVGSKNLTDSVYINFLNYTIIINEFIRKTAKLKANKNIINITSGAATSAHHGLAPYCSTQSALEMFGQCIFLEQQKLKQIKILNFRPGVMNTTMQAKLRTSSKKDFSQTEMYQDIFNAKKLREPREVAEKLYNILEQDKFWKKPILDVSEISISK
jgi:benzil reductase ((S)-benzoin forming)